MREDENWTTHTPDLDALGAEIAAEMAAGVRAARQDVWEEVAVAAERGQTGYIPVRGSRVASPEEQAMWLEEIAPLMAAEVRRLRERLASSGLTAQEEGRLSVADSWLQRFAPEAGGRDT